MLLDAAPKPVSLANKDIWTLCDLLHLNCRFPSSLVIHICVRFQLAGDTIHLIDCGKLSCNEKTPEGAFRSQARQGAKEFARLVSHQRFLLSQTSRRVLLSTSPKDRQRGLPLMAFPVCLAAYMHLASMTGPGFPNFAGKTSREESFSLACFQTHGMLHA